eukprot:6003025-Amphidinium_carterae.1
MEEASHVSPTVQKVTKPQQMGKTVRIWKTARIFNKTKPQQKTQGNQLNIEIKSNRAITMALD